MVVGQHGHNGLSVHLSVTLESKQENDCAIHLYPSMEAAAALGHTYRQETVTPIPVLVLQQVFLLLKPWTFFVHHINNICMCAC